MELQGAQQTHRLEHLSDVHLQAALQLDEEPADLWMDLSILRSYRGTEKVRASSPSTQSEFYNNNNNNVYNNTNTHKQEN